jgi:hypothetical protein
MVLSRLVAWSNAALTYARWYGERSWRLCSLQAMFHAERIP